MAANGRHDFQGVSSAALASAELLLPEWLPGAKRGNEWVGLRKANGGPGDSWKVNLDTGVWAHFGAGSNGTASRGGDLIDLYAALRHVDLGTACEQLAQQLGINDQGIPVLPTRMPVRAQAKPKAPEPKSDPIPVNAPPIPIHGRHGQHSALYRYGTAFYVARYDLPDGKEFGPWTWRNNKWANRGYGDGKPLYRAEELVKHPNAQVLIVEGEKCADLGASALPFQVVVSWCGGSNAVKGTDWSALAGREVIIWPDADDAGRSAAAEIVRELKGIAARVRVMTLPPDTSQGWDIADAIAEGTTGNDLGEFMRKCLAPGAPIGELITADERIDSKNYPDGQPPHSAMVAWQSMGLACNTNKIPHGTLGNASIILQNHEEFRGKIWLDTFRGKVYHSMDGAPKLWTDSQTRRITAWIQQQLNIPKITVPIIEDAYQHAAECNARNSLTDWLDSLEWDGIERLDTWLEDCLGLERNEYNDAVARNWPISMVARAYQPGCQVDTMPVLEGKMGRGKSSFLKILADPWFAAIQIAFGEKDFYQAIQGRWLIEIPDMSGFSRREHSHILATITTREDVYRKSHGRVTEEHPRVTVFAATSETDDYLQDTRGRRRYWPLRCGEINLDTLHKQRKNIFAEAVARYRAGTAWYEMPDQANEEQLARSEGDLWGDALVQSAEQLWDLQERTGINSKITSSRLLEEIGVKIHLQTDSEKKRVARVMSDAGWIHPRTKVHRYWKKVLRKE
jgi:predicted P-loop ATPase